MVTEYVLPPADMSDLVEVNLLFERDNGQTNNLETVDETATTNSVSLCDASEKLDATNEANEFGSIRMCHGILVEYRDMIGKADSSAAVASRAIYIGGGVRKGQRATVCREKIL